MQIFITFLLVTSSCGSKKSMYDKLYPNEYSKYYEVGSQKVMKKNEVNTEKFDDSILEGLIVEDIPVDEVENSLQGIYMKVFEDGIYYSVLPKGSNFANVKLYDKKTLQIREEGQIFVRTRFRVGVWKFYNKNGYLERIVDYDKPFLFSLEDVFEYCKKHRIKIPYPTLDPSFIDNISRSFCNGEPRWIILDVGYGSLVREIVLDGKTGEVLKFDIDNRTK